MLHAQLLIGGLLIIFCKWIFFAPEGSLLRGCGDRTEKNIQQQKKFKSFPDKLHAECPQSNFWTHMLLLIVFFFEVSWLVVVYVIWKLHLFIIDVKENIKIIIKASSFSTLYSPSYKSSSSYYINSITLTQL